jgi:hypothetical protein
MANHLVNQNLNYKRNLVSFYSFLRVAPNKHSLERMSLLNIINISYPVREKEAWMRYWIIYSSLNSKHYCPKDIESEVERNIFIIDMVTCKF